MTQKGFRGYKGKVLRGVTGIRLLCHCVLMLRQDHLPASTQLASGAAMQGQSRIEALDLESVQKAYEADTLKLSTDMASFMQYVSRCTATQRQIALTKVLTLKSEQRRGAQAVVDWMARNCKFSAAKYHEDHLNVAEARA